MGHDKFTGVVATCAGVIIWMDIGMDDRLHGSAERRVGLVGSDRFDGGDDTGVSCCTELRCAIRDERDHCRGRHVTVEDSFVSYMLDLFKV